MAALTPPSERPQYKNLGNTLWFALFIGAVLAGHYFLYYLPGLPPLALPVLAVIIWSLLRSPRSDWWRSGCLLILAAPLLVILLHVPHPGGLAAEPAHSYTSLTGRLGETLLAGYVTDSITLLPVTPGLTGLTPHTFVQEAAGMLIYLTLFTLISIVFLWPCHRPVPPTPSTFLSRLLTGCVGIALFIGLTIEIALDYPPLLAAQAWPDGGRAVLWYWSLAGLAGLFCILPLMDAASTTYPSPPRQTSLTEQGLWVSLLFCLSLLLELSFIQPGATFAGTVALYVWSACRFSYLLSQVALCLGFFVLIPVFAAHAENLTDTVTLLGLYIVVVACSQLLLSVRLGVEAKRSEGQPPPIPPSLPALPGLSESPDRQTTAEEPGLESELDRGSESTPRPNAPLNADQISSAGLAGLSRPRQSQLQSDRAERHHRSFDTALIESIGTPLLILNDTLHIEVINPAASALFGISEELTVGKSYLELCVPRAFRNETEWKIQKVLKTGNSVENFETETHRDSHVSTILWNISRLPETERFRHSVVLTGQDITPIRETQNQLYYLAHYDVLTEAANRRLFEDRCTQAIKHSLRHHNSIGLISLDIDHFKKINDSLGHDAGDILLKEISRRIRECLRDEDTVARLGGDEFAVLLTNVTDEKGCQRVAENLLERITHPIELPGKTLTITTSIGVTLCPRDATDYPSLLKNADMAMYEAKSAGRNNIKIYREQMHLEAKKLLDFEQELRIALQKGQFELYYQPQIDLKTGAMYGVEALLRWHHPVQGLLRPSGFIQIAEQCGLLPSLSHWIILNACLQAKAIRAMHGQPIKVSVNLSARQFQSKQIVADIGSALAETRMEPELLCLEITESVLLNNAKKGKAILEELSRYGVEIVIDSFGSGLSSMSNLARLPVKTLKIDRQLTRSIPGDRYEIALMETLLDIANRMDKLVIVEGVETREQEEFFRQHGVRICQGHLYSSPIPSTQLPEFFQANREGGYTQP